MILDVLAPNLAAAWQVFVSSVDQAVGVVLALLLVPAVEEVPAV